MNRWWYEYEPVKDGIKAKAIHLGDGQKIWKIEAKYFTKRILPYYIVAEDKKTAKKLFTDIMVLPISTIRQLTEEETEKVLEKPFDYFVI